MTYPLILLLLLLLPGSAICQSSFKSTQLTYSRVREAYQEKEVYVKQLFTAKEVDLTKASLYFRAFKQEKILEIWAKPSDKDIYQLITTYPVCAISGKLGPKRFEGDYQIPEGFYYIDRFNPQSNFHLSLGINYPNASDKILGLKNKLGGDIFIHGNCVTIGCLPMTDEWIKEIYVMAVEAKSNGQKQIPVHIFPAQMNDQNFASLLKNFATDKALTDFWAVLKTGFELFEKQRKLPIISISSTGEYAYK